MIVTTKISMDLTNAALQQTVDVMQDDKYSRDLRIALYAGSKPLVLPQITGVLVRYTKPDGKQGLYDTMPDGSCAWHISGNEVTVGLAPQICTVPGRVAMHISLLQGEAQLSCFQLFLQVQPLPQANMPSEDYENTLLCLPQCSGAVAGRYLQVSQVDNGGRVMALQAVELPELPELGEAGAVTHTPQVLTPAQKAQARANIDGAPAGYGMGENVAEQCADANAAALGGTYAMTAATANKPLHLGSGILHVFPGGEGSGCIQMAVDSAGGAAIRAGLSGGEWSSWAYCNPPMAVGTEYRTAEQWQEKTVYCKLVDCGPGPASGGKMVETGVPSQKIVRFSLLARGEGVYSFGMDGVYLSGYPVESNIYISSPTGYNLSGYTVYYTVYYTKD